MKLPPPTDVRLRRTTHEDVAALFEIQLDPAGNELAGTKPRDRAAFEARWEEILKMPQDPAVRVTPRVILADGELVGSINVFPQEGVDSIGYWIARGHWGRGIATRAVALLVAEVEVRPLFARVIAHNVASLRALEKNGFVAVLRGAAEGNERYVGGERVVLRLGGD